MEHYFQSAIAPNSQRTYTSAQQRYIRFCTAVGLAPLPATEHQLCRYASFLASENLVHSTIKGYLSAIRHLQIATGWPDPGISSMPKLEGVLRGIKATQARTPTSTHTRLPIMPPIIKRVGEVWEALGPSQDHIMLWGAVTLAFFGFLRSGELTVPSDSAFDPAAHLTFDDVKVDNITNPTLLKIRLKASKTDPFRNGIDIVVGKTNKKQTMSAHSCTGIPGCTREWPRVSVQIPGRKTPHKASFCGGSPPGPGQSWIRPKGLHGPLIPNRGSHNSGLNDSTIQMLGRWSSSAYLVYVRTPREQLATYSSVLGQDQS